MTTWPPWPVWPAPSRRPQALPLTRPARPRPKTARPPPAPTPRDPQMAATIAGLIEGAAQMGSEFSGFESPRQLVDDSVCQYLGVVWARVAYKRGWNMKAILGDYGSEITAIAATGMIAFKVAKACEKEAEVKARQAAADQARTVTADPVPNGS